MTKFLRIPDFNVSMLNIVSSLNFELIIIQFYIFKNYQFNTYELW